MSTRNRNLENFSRVRYNRVPKSARIIPIIFITIFLSILIFVADAILSQKYIQIAVENKILLSFYCILIAFIVANVIDLVRGFSNKF